MLSVQLEQCYRQLPIALVVNLVNGVILAAVLWPVVEATLVVSWLLVLVAVTFARFLNLRAFRNAPRDAHLDIQTWKPYLASGAGAAGVAWGLAGGLLFHPDSFPHQAFLAFLLGGMVAGAIPLLSPVRHAYPLFAVPAVLPIAIRMLAVGEQLHLVMGLMILIFGLAMLASSAQVHRIFRDAERLRRELSSTKEASHELEKLIRLDPLTGIPNRRLFEEELWREWRRSEREAQTLSVISADIDHFKGYNDHFGHPAGDQCLIKVAQAMAQALSRPGDVVARIGGEEFAFLLPDTTPEGARSVAEQVRASVLALNLPHPTSPVCSQVSASFGIASSDHASVSSPADLLRASDAALYEAKRNGRNRVSVIGQ